LWAGLCQCGFFQNRGDCLQSFYRVQTALVPGILVETYDRYLSVEVGTSSGSDCETCWGDDFKVLFRVLCGLLSLQPPSSPSCTPLYSPLKLRGSCEKFGTYPLTLPSPTRGEGKHIEIRKKFPPPCRRSR